MTRRFTLFVVLLSLVGGLLASLGTQSDANWATLERADLVLRAPVEGTLEAVESVSISPPAVRRIYNFKISMLIPEGTEVKKGDLVVSFDTRELQQTLRSRQNDRESATTQLEKSTSVLEIERQDLDLTLAEAEANLRKINLKLEVPEHLVARRVQQLDRIEKELAEFEIGNIQERLNLLETRTDAELSALRRKRDRATRTVAQIQKDLKAMQVVSPRAGTVIYHQERGEKPKVGDQVWRARMVLKIPNLDRMKAVGKVDEAELGRLTLGQPVELRLDAHPELSIPGTLATLGTAVERRSTTDPSKAVRVEVEIDMKNLNSDLLRPGMRFRGAVEVTRVPNVLCLPPDAPNSKPEGPVVTRQSGWSQDKVIPTLGRRSDECIEVLEGLDAGDRVLLPEIGS